MNFLELHAPLLPFLMNIDSEKMAEKFGGKVGLTVVNQDCTSENDRASAWFPNILNFGL